MKIRSVGSISDDKMPPLRPERLPGFDHLRKVGASESRPYLTESCSQNEDGWSGSAPVTRPDCQRSCTQRRSQNVEWRRGSA